MFYSLTTWFLRIEKKKPEISLITGFFNGGE